MRSRARPWSPGSGYESSLKRRPGRPDEVRRAREGDDRGWPSRFSDERPRAAAVVGDFWRYQAPIRGPRHVAPQQPTAQARYGPFSVEAGAQNGLTVATMNEGGFDCAAVPRYTLSFSTTREASAEGWASWGVAVGRYSQRERALRLERARRFG